MAHEPDDLVSLGRGMSVLAACIIQEAARSDPTFEARVLKRLEEACREVRDHSTHHDPGLALALIASTRSLLTGISLRGEQKAPFLADRLGQ